MQKYSIVETQKPDDPAPTYSVRFLPTGENLSHHETRSEARAAMRRYEAADKRRAVSP
jgi:hypothetical protein